MAAGFDVSVLNVNIRTVEALYQACRFPDFPEIQKLIIEQRSPMAAKMVSRRFQSYTRSDWDKIRVRLMRWCLTVKLSQNYEKFGSILQLTGNAPIVELSTKDQFWGASPVQNRLKGCNVLGRLLMELRQKFLDYPPEYFSTILPPLENSFMLYGQKINAVTAKEKFLKSKGISVYFPATQMKIPTLIDEVISHEKLFFKRKLK